MKSCPAFLKLLIALSLTVSFAILLAPQTLAFQDWLKHSGGPVLFPGQNTWENSFIWQPAAIYDGQEFKVWYGGFNGSRFQIGLAHSQDGINWAKDPNNPVVSRLSLDNKDVDAPTVLFDGSNYVMWYGGSEINASGNRLNFAIYRAISDDGIHWINDPIDAVFQPPIGWAAATSPYVLKNG